MIWLAVGMLVLSMGISIYTANKNADKLKPSSLNDMNIPQVDEGTEQAVFFGDCWTGDWMVLWVGNLRTSKIKSNSGKSLKKLAKKALKATIIISTAGVLPYADRVKGLINR